HVEESTESGTTSGVFVGRSAELALLADAFEATRGGAPITVLVHGESGIGKSMLVRRMAAELHGRLPDVLVLAGRCYERESVPYKALDEVIDALSRRLADFSPAEVAAFLPEHTRLAAQAFPALRRLVAVEERDAGLPDRQQLRALLFATMRELFRRLAARQRLLVVIDDLHWADS